MMKVEMLYLSALFQVILQPDLQLSHHHLALPLSDGLASLVVSGHQGVDVCEYHVDDRHLLQLLLLCIQLLSTHGCLTVSVAVYQQVWKEPCSPFVL